MNEIESVRIDKWLWAVRLFKSRTHAAAACNNGKVKRSNKSVKAATIIHVGDTLEVPTHDGLYKRQIQVVKIYEKRVGAPLAQQAYLDHTSPDILQEAAEKKSLQRKNRLLRKEGDQGRMTKKQLRDWRKGLHSYKNRDNLS